MNKGILWTQEWGTYDYPTVICCGFENYEEIIKIMKDDKCHQWESAFISHKDHLNSMVKNPHFSKWYVLERGRDIFYSVLWLPDWKSDNEHYGYLAHELIHAISFVLGGSIDLIKENELFAYQHTFLFREISKKLDGFIKKKSVGISTKKK